MREIYFRAKRDDDNQWVYGDLTHVRRIVENGTKPQVRVGGYNVLEDTVGQSTGLKDKFGTTIFEGDYLKTETGKKRITEYRNGAYMSINPRYLGKENEEIHSFVLCPQWTKYVSVVGNKFDEQYPSKIDPIEELNEIEPLQFFCND